MSDDRTVAAALEAHYRQVHLNAPVESERWARVKFAGVPLVFPNLSARVRALKLHDIHHVATGYRTDLCGEAEQSAWELGAGCHHHWFAWGINLAMVGVGVFLCPRRMLRAFFSGRRSETLYRGEFTAELLSLTVAELRARLHITKSAP